MLLKQNKTRIVSRVMEPRTKWESPFITPTIYANNIVNRLAGSKKAPRETTAPKRKKVTKPKRRCLKTSSPQKKVVKRKPARKNISKLASTKKLGFPSNQPMDRVAGGYVENHPSAAPCQHCENMAKNLVYLENLIRANSDPNRPCCTCNFCLQHLKRLNKSILKTYENFDASFETSRADDYEELQLRHMLANLPSLTHFPATKQSFATNRKVPTLSKVKPKVNKKLQSPPKQNRPNKFFTATPTIKHNIPQQSEYEVPGYAISYVKNAKSKKPQKPKTGLQTRAPMHPRY